MNSLRDEGSLSATFDNLVRPRELRRMSLRSHPICSVASRTHSRSICRQPGHTRIIRRCWWFRPRLLLVSKLRWFSALETANEFSSRLNPGLNRRTNVHDREEPTSNCSGRLQCPRNHCYRGGRPCLGNSIRDSSLHNDLADVEG